MEVRILAQIMDLLDGAMAASEGVGLGFQDDARPGLT